MANFILAYYPILVQCWLRYLLQRGNASFLLSGSSYHL